MFQAQEVQCSELSAEAQGSEMSRALLAQTPGVTQSSTGLKGTETQSGKRGQAWKEQCVHRLSPTQDSKVHPATVSLLQSC